MIKINNKLLTYALLISAACFFIITKAEVVFNGPLQKIGQARSVIFLEDAHKEKFVLKYHRGPDFAIIEALATKIGKSIGMNINDVKILPAQSPHIKDYIDNQITTLHTHVPGDEVGQTHLNSTIDICGGLGSSSNLNSLTEDTNLSDIVALDIFTNNPDRHNGNFFFHFLTQQFYAIDMDWSFRRDSNLSGRAYNFLTDYHKNNPQLLPQQIEALKRINEILSKLLYKYTPQQLYKELLRLEAIAKHNFSDKAEFKRYFQLYYCQTKYLHFYLNSIIAANAQNNSFNRPLKQLEAHIRNIKLICWLFYADPRTVSVELSTNFQQLKSSIMQKLSAFPKAFA